MKIPNTQQKVQYRNNERLSIRAYSSRMLLKSGEKCWPFSNIVKVEKLSPTFLANYGFEKCDQNGKNSTPPNDTSLILNDDIPSHAASALPIDDIPSPEVAASPNYTCDDFNDDIAIREAASALVDFFQQTYRDLCKAPMAAACTPVYRSGAKSGVEDPVPQKKIHRGRRPVKSCAVKRKTFHQKSTSTSPNVENEAATSLGKKRKREKVRSLGDILKTAALCEIKILSAEHGDQQVRADNVDPVETDNVAQQVRTVTGTHWDDVVEIIDIESDNEVMEGSDNEVMEESVMGIDLNKSPTHQVWRRKKERLEFRAAVDDQGRDSFSVIQQIESQSASKDNNARLKIGGSSSRSQLEKPRAAAEILAGNLHVSYPNSQFLQNEAANLSCDGKENPDRNSHYLERFLNGSAHPFPNQPAEFPHSRHLGEMQLNPQPILRCSLFPGDITAVDMLKPADAGLRSAQKLSFTPAMAHLNVPDRSRLRQPPPSKSRYRNLGRPSIPKRKAVGTSIPPGAVPDPTSPGKEKVPSNSHPLSNCRRNEPGQDSVNGFCQLNRKRAEIVSLLDIRRPRWQ